MIIDTHAHLADEDLLPIVEDVLAKAAKVNVNAMLCVATTLQSTKLCIAIAERYRSVRASAGIHPNYSASAEPGDLEQVAELATHPRVAAIGETGLDRYWDDAPWDVQLATFQKQIELARTLDKPLIIHTRECAEETLAFLQSEFRHGPFKAVMHSFTGPQAVADGCLELGLYISFAGMLTYKNAEDIRQIAIRIPEDRLLVETDSPYLTPHPHRGKRPNTPSMVVHTLEKLAEIRGVSPRVVAEQTTRNAIALFGPWN